MANYPSHEQAEAIRDEAVRRQQLEAEAAAEAEARLIDIEDRLTALEGN